MLYSCIRIIARYPKKLPPNPPDNKRGTVGWASHIIEKMTNLKVLPGEILYVKRINKLILEAR